jgi:hypothetical protein
MFRRALALGILVACAACDSAASSGSGGGGTGGGAAATLGLPAGAAVGDELVVTVRASSVGGSWGDASNPGAVLTLRAGHNVPRDVILVGGFPAETKASLGAWDGGDVTWTLTGEATFDGLELSIDPTAAGIPVIALPGADYANDSPLVVFRQGDELEYVMTNEDGGTGLLPTLLLARWGRPHDIEGLFDVVSQTYQGPNHETLGFDGPYEGSHPRLRIATANGLVEPEPADATPTYRVSPMPVPFAEGDTVPRERVLDDLPWLVAAGWLEVEREGKVDPSGGVDDSTLGALGAYVFVDYALTGGVKASFEAEVDGTWYSSLGIYTAPSTLLDAHASGTGRTAIELPQGDSITDVTGVRVVPAEGTGTLETARLLAYDPSTYEVVIRGDTVSAVPVDPAVGAVVLDGL